MTADRPGVGTVVFVSIVTSLIVSTLTVVALVRVGGDTLARLAGSPSAAVKTAMVPDLSGMRSGAADELLTARGLRFVVSERRQADSEPDTVVQQSPLPQSRVEVGSQVSVVVSAGQAGSKVPAVVGMPVEQAKVAVQNVGLALGALSDADAGIGKPGHVVAIAPPVGTALAAGSPVVLSVARQATVKVPKLLNRHIREARKRIERAGLKVGDVRERYDNRRRGYVVLEQTPGAGEQATKGSSVDLIINQGD